METEKFDILIINAQTRRVSSIAAPPLPLESHGLRPSAASVMVELCPGVRNGFELAIVPERQFGVGSVVPEEVETTQPKPRRAKPKDWKGPAYREREANSQCVKCGSTDLASDYMCERCLEKNREALRKSRSPI
jgi:hypothetical protein